MSLTGDCHIDLHQVKKNNNNSWSGFKSHIFAKCPAPTLNISDLSLSVSKTIILNSINRLTMQVMKTLVFYWKMRIWEETRTTMMMK